MRKITAVLTLVLLWAVTVATTACTGQNVAQDIVNWTPALQSAVATVDSTAALIDPGAAPIFIAATVGFDTASNLLVAQCKAYLANPTAGVLAQLQTQVLTFQSNVNASVLAAAKIVDPASQQRALGAVNAVAAIVSAILALVASISKNTSAVAAQVVIVKTSQVREYLNDHQAARIVATHYGITEKDALSLVSADRQFMCTAGM
jgi:hypothetical protein